MMMMMNNINNKDYSESTYATSRHLKHVSSTQPEHTEVQNTARSNTETKLPFPRDGLIGAEISIKSWPYPRIAEEGYLVDISYGNCNLMMSLWMVVAVSILSASFVVPIVRERESGSKHV